MKTNPSIMEQTTTTTPFPRMKWTAGSDPELCIFDNEQNKMVSSLSLLPDKHNPIDLKNGIHVYADNVLIEASFPPVTCKKDFIGIYRESFKRIQQHLGKRYSLVPIASYIYDDSELKDEKAWEIGCSPNYNARTESINPMVKFTNGLRTTSCHIHIGGPDKLTDFDIRNQTVKLLDIFVGCASVIFDKDIEASKARRLYYGRSSEHRPCPYGVEYRVLGSFCLRSPQLMELVYDLVDYTLSIVEADNQTNILALAKDAEVVKAIDNCDIELARKVLTDAKLPKELFERVEQEYDTKSFNANWGI
jgi:hypothetical protein